MTYRLIFISFFFISIRLFAQNYPAEIISHDIECLVDEKNKLTVTKSLLIQINSPLGREHAQMKIYYDNKSSIKSIDVKILTNKYALIRTIKSKEIEDYSVLTGYFHTDDRYKEIKAFHNTYPYLIELKYIQEFDEFFSFPTWYPQNGENIPLIKSSYSLTVPYGYSFHKKFYNINPQERVQKTESTKTYIWRIVNLAPLNVQESFLPSIKSIYPTARFIPDEFVFGGIKGTSTTWKDIGNWQSKLISGLDELPETEMQKVLELTKQATNDYEKVKLIYSYLQNETRYIGIFIGIGGWKPYDATYVCNNKFGDCKALTNYMMAMLKAFGIKSYYSLIIADDDEPDIDTSFPGMYFNHVVLCVPVQNDTLWLECTSQSNPFNYWGTFTNGKHALVCDFENSYIAQTPQFEHHTNFVNQSSKVIVQDGKLIVNMERQLFGEAFEKVKNNLKYNSDKDVIDIATKTLPFKNYSLTNVKYHEINMDGLTGYNETLQLTFSNNIQAYGSNLIITPFNKFIETQFQLNTNRQNPISVLYNYKITDTTQYNIPEGFELEVLPDDFQASTRFGKFEVKYIQEENNLIISTFIELNKGLYSQTDYADFKSFINGIINSENQKILIKKL
jgi:hypothetical protein